MNIQIMEILFKFNFDFTSSFVTLIWQSIKIGHPTFPHSKTVFIHEFSTWYTFLHLGKLAHVLSRWQSRIFLSCSLTESSWSKIGLMWRSYGWSTMKERWVLCPWALSRSDIYKHYILIWTWCLKLRHLYPNISSILAFPQRWFWSETNGD